MRNLGPGRTLRRHILDHLTAEQEGWHLLKKRLLAIQRADAHRAINLVAGKGKEINVEVGHINRHMRHRLCAVTDKYRACFMGNVGEGLHVIDMTKHV